LQLLGADELHEIIAEQGRIAVRCEFCNRGYTLAENEIPGLVHGGATTLH
jgi:redox-regulated HSP33 family molecular chaperone